METKIRLTENTNSNYLFYYVDFTLKPHKRTFLTYNNSNIMHDLPKIRSKIEIAFNKKYGELYFSLYFGFEIIENILCISNMWDSFICECGTWIENIYNDDEFIKITKNIQLDLIKSNKKPTEKQIIEIAKTIFDRFLQTHFPNTPFNLCVANGFVDDSSWCKIQQKIDIKQTKFEDVEKYVNVVDDKIVLAILFNNVEVIKNLIKKGSNSNYLKFISLAIKQQNKDCLIEIYKNINGGYYKELANKMIYSSNIICLKELENTLTTEDKQ